MSRVLQLPARGRLLVATDLQGCMRDFERIEQKDCPFQPRPPGPLAKHARWVRPERVVEVSFSEWTAGGAARHPLLQGFRTDKPAKDVRREG